MTAGMVCLLLHIFPRSLKNEEYAVTGSGAETGFQCGASRHPFCMPHGPEQSHNQYHNYLSMGKSMLQLD